jgi:hypothetical protein
MNLSAERELDRIRAFATGKKQPVGGIIYDWRHDTQTNAPISGNTLDDRDRASSLGDIHKSSRGWWDDDYDKYASLYNDVRFLEDETGKPRINKTQSILDAMERQTPFNEFLKYGSKGKPESTRDAFKPLSMDQYKSMPDREKYYYSAAGDESGVTSGVRKHTLSLQDINKNRLDDFVESRIKAAPTVERGLSEIYGTYGIGSMEKDPTSFFSQAFDQGMRSFRVPETPPEEIKGSIYEQYVNKDGIISGDKEVDKTLEDAGSTVNEQITKAADRLSKAVDVNGFDKMIYNMADILKDVLDSTTLNVDDTPLKVDAPKIEIDKSSMEAASQIVQKSIAKGISSSGGGLGAEKINKFEEVLNRFSDDLEATERKQDGWVDALSNLQREQRDIYEELNNVKEDNKYRVQEALKKSSDIEVSLSKKISDVVDNTKSDVYNYLSKLESMVNGLQDKLVSEMGNDSLNDKINSLQDKLLSEIDKKASINELKEYMVIIKDIENNLDSKNTEFNNLIQDIRSSINSRIDELNNKVEVVSDKTNQINSEFTEAIQEAEERYRSTLKRDVANLEEKIYRQSNIGISDDEISNKLNSLKFEIMKDIRDKDSLSLQNIESRLNEIERMKQDSAENVGMQDQLNAMEQDIKGLRSELIQVNAIVSANIDNIKNDMQTKLRVLEDGIGSIANDDSVKSAKFNDDIEKVKGNVERLGKYVSEFNDELDLYKNKAGKDRELLNNVISLARNAYTKVDSVANEVNNLNTKVSKVQDISHNINMPNY